jgi:hypothetical protein
VCAETPVVGVGMECRTLRLAPSRGIANCHVQGMMLVSTPFLVPESAADLSRIRDIRFVIQ